MSPVVYKIYLFLSGNTTMFWMVAVRKASHSSELRMATTRRHLLGVEKMRRRNGAKMPRAGKRIRCLSQIELYRAGHTQPRFIHARCHTCLQTHSRPSLAHFCMAYSRQSGSQLESIRMDLHSIRKWLKSLISRGHRIAYQLRGWRNDATTQCISG